MTDPGALLQDWLDRVGAATLAGDWPTYAAHVSLPFRLVTDTAVLSVTTEAELRRGFEGFVAALRSQAASDYVRLVTAAALPEADRLEGSYASHILSNGNRVLPRYESAITLNLQHGTWRATSMTTTLNNDRWPIDLPGVTRKV